MLGEFCLQAYEHHFVFDVFPVWTQGNASSKMLCLSGRTAVSDALGVRRDERLHRLEVMLDCCIPLAVYLNAGRPEVAERLVRGVTILSGE